MAPPPCDVDGEDALTEDLCMSPAFLKMMSESGVLLFTCIIFISLQKMSVTSLRWTLMGVLSWVFIKDSLELDTAVAVSVALHAVLAIHLPMMSRKLALVALALTAFVHYDERTGVLGKGDLLGLATVLGGCGALWRAWVLLTTFRATATVTNAFPLLSRTFPAFTFSDDYFFRADGCPADVAAKRRRSFDGLKGAWATKWPKSAEAAQYLKRSFSDLRFASSNRVFLPFNRLLDDSFDPATVVVASAGVALEDVDGQRLVDISGSYGVNVCGTDRYKGFLARGSKAVEGVGPVVLGPLHPLVASNIAALKDISQKQEVSFHMSGTEAVMAALRLCRYNTGRRLVVLFGGSYHGWWDGVQSSAGNERAAYDVLTLNDLDPIALQVLRLRRSEIACVVVNPLQAFHPNKPPPSDLVLLSNSRNAGDRENDYQKWLKRLRRTCDANGLALVFDEVYTGFRLAVGGAQAYYGVTADMVVYGKTLGGGMPVGVVCGPHALMQRTDGAAPLRCAYVIGTFSAAPLTMACMAEFLAWLKTKDAEEAYASSRVRVAAWVEAMNAALAAEGLPLRVAAYASVWTMLFTQPGRYHWFLQYLLRDEGVQLSWVGTGRLNFSLDFDDDALLDLKERLLRACRRMRDEGWWLHAPSALGIKLRTGLEVGKALLWALAGRTAVVY